MNRRGVLADPSVRLVRADVAGARARHLHVLQNLPGHTSSVRRAIPGEGDDGRAAHVEYWRVGWRLRQATEWAGPIAELGLPGPVPRGFEITRGLRMYRVRERSMVLRVNGAGRIVSFTGEDLPRTQHGTMQHAAARSDPDLAAEYCRGCHVGLRVHGRIHVTMPDLHPTTMHHSTRPARLRPSLRLAATA
jgi:hypothetical protein